MSQPSLGNRSTVAESKTSLPVVFLGMALTELLCAGFRLEVYGEEYLRHSPGALILSNHRSDNDGPILANVILQRRGWQSLGVKPYIVAREDLFRKGFLSNYLTTWPRPIRKLLGRLCLRSLLGALQVRPIRRVPEHTLGALLEDVHHLLGDVPLSKILRPEWAQRFADQVGRTFDPLSVRQALNAPDDLLSLSNAYRRLNLKTLRILLPHERHTIAAQLQVFVELLEAGETVILEPEGRVSPDGSFHKPRQALHHLLNVPNRVPHVLPVALSYDLMCAGRPRVLIRFGNPRYDLSGLPRRETDILAQRAVLQEWTVTLSHLAARYLRESGLKRLTPENHGDFAQFVATMVDRCKVLDVNIDPVLINSKKRERRQSDCLAFWQGRIRSDISTKLHFLNNELDAIAAIHPGLFPGDSQ